MPNRILRDWTDSFKVDELSVQAERFFVRLIMKVDDYGRFYADCRLLKANLFPLKSDVRDTDITRWTAECEKAGLLAVYNVAKKEYLQITDFKQQLRQKQEKYPAPPPLNECYADAKQTHSNSEADAALKRNESETETESETKEKGGSTPTPKKPAAKKILFRESPLADLAVFKAAFEGTKYEQANLDYYHEVVMNWSDGNSNRKVDWVATARNFMAGDLRDGKFVSQDFKPKQNAATNAGFKRPASIFSPLSDTKSILDGRSG